ncbi:HHL239Wp [Eremothecium sinecaudum]|uniref:HHL239Wp n=1 Tax=Eremothecium sinecaudum TaxID=45286 RepID=A0A120K2T5_9SACH|nr:HHL239Wp [Eremothecium sinecaudum]AMD22531.1 HHL239Wp [Eremothecium sinecaudum]
MTYTELKDVSSDYLGGICLHDELNQLIVASWDGTVSLYDWEQNKLLGRLRHKWSLTSVALCVGSTKCYVGSVQGEILELDWESERLVLVQGVSCTLGVSCMGSYGHYLVAGSWDGSFIVIDTRRNSVSTKQKLIGKVLSLDCSESRIVCLTTDGIFVFDALNLNNPPIRRDSGLKYQSRCIKLVGKDAGYVQSSIDGRVAVEYFDNSVAKFAFRCHRLNLKDMQLVFPVNALCFNPISGMLYTGGADGKVVAWNLVSKKKSEELPKVEDSVVKLCCNKKALIIAACDDSFKTGAVADDVKLHPSRIYIMPLKAS